jgi:outer membrane protein assembly factor BamB
MDAETWPGPHHSEDVTRLRRLWLRRVAAVLCALALLYCWFQILTVWMAVGPRPSVFLWIAAAITDLGILIVLAAGYTKLHQRTTRLSSRLVGLALLWTLCAFVLWHTFCSPLARDASVAAGFAISTWWLLWAWIMFFVPWPWAARFTFGAILLVLCAALLWDARADGWDGDGRPRVVWRLVASAPRPPAAPATTPPSGASHPAADTGPDYPRFRGADGLATVHGAKLARDWSRNGPKVRWRRAVGAGWSALAVAGDGVFTQEQRDDDECVVCYDRASGHERWVHSDAAHYRNSGAGDGPRATPTVDATQVYALGATGILNALDRATGAPHWTVNIVVDNDTQAPPHGTTGSPLVVDDLIVVSAGGPKDASLVAYDKNDGHRRWRAGSDPAGYASPMLLVLAGTPQIVIVNAKTLCAHDPRSGSILWSLPWANDQVTNCSQPYPAGDDRLFVSSDYGRGCALLELAQADGRLNPKPLWESQTMQTKFCSAVLHDGHAYGFDDGILECVSLADGLRRWKRGRYGHGQLLLADDLLLIVAEDGRIVLVEANPDKHVELAEMPALDGKTWNHPALTGSDLWVRNDREAVCYELPLEAP